MRTTVTLDADVDAHVRELARQRGVSFRVALNDVVRRGLATDGATPPPYRVPVRSMGLRADVDLDRALHLSVDLEDAATLRELHLRK